MLKSFVFIAFFIFNLKAFANPLLIEDPVEIKNLEQNGLEFNSLIFSTRATNNKNLYENSLYKSFVANIESHLEELKNKDHLLGVGMQFGHRLFDVRWLKSPSARFELVGVVNRLDRAVFDLNSCGELRLIYRLAYEQEQNGILVRSRMPMTVNAVFKLPFDSNCQSVANSWVSAQSEALKSWTSKKWLKSLEVNLQTVRWPSTIRGDMGGSAEYLLQVNKIENGSFVLSPLENTPDVEKIGADPSLKKELLNWLLIPENIKALDEGVINIPEKFLAKSVSSFALHGMNRLSNRPYDVIFNKDDFSSVNFSDLKNIYGPSSMRRRLNDMTCMGCHQGRTIAGFHFLGKDSSTTIFANSIYSSQSPHLIEEQNRRNIYFQNILKGKVADNSRPFSERNPKIPGEMNAHCGLPGSEYKEWTCREGLKCVAVINPETSQEIGECLPIKPVAGNPCEPGLISQRFDANKDIVKAKIKMNCSANQQCEATRVGFPGGMCSGGCSNLKPGETCGSIAILQGFNQCLGANNPFEICLEQNVRPASLQACDDETACRADYVCTKTKSKEGACIPPYFLFQLRLDGHPRPII